MYERLRVRTTHREEVGKLVAEAEAVARPRVLYKMAFIEAKGDESITADGVTFNSRVLRVNLDSLHRFFAFVGTAGPELEAWVDSQRTLTEAECWLRLPLCVPWPTSSTPVSRGVGARSDEGAALAADLEPPGYLHPLVRLGCPYHRVNNPTGLATTCPPPLEVLVP